MGSALLLIEEVKAFKLHFWIWVNNKPEVSENVVDKACTKPRASVIVVRNSVLT